MADQVVWKFPLSIDLSPGGVQKIELTTPGYVRPFAYAVQDGEAFAWAIVYPDAEPYTRTLLAVATGFGPDRDHGYHVATLVGIKGWMVAHLFEDVPEDVPF